MPLRRLADGNNRQNGQGCRYANSSVPHLDAPPPGILPRRVIPVEGCPFAFARAPKIRSGRPRWTRPLTRDAYRSAGQRAVIKGTFVMSASRKIRGRLNMQSPGLNI